MLQNRLQREECQRRHLSVSLARCQDEVYEAQRLRYKVFEEEMGARVPGRDLGIDCDRFDPYCEHLLVRDSGTNRVVGTYRILNGAMTRPWQPMQRSRVYRRKVGHGHVAVNGCAT